MPAWSCDHTGGNHLSRDLLNPVYLLIHARTEKFDVVDATWTVDLMVITELREDCLKLAPTAHLACGQGLESLNCPSGGRLLIDLPIRSNHGVMGCIRNRTEGPKKVMVL